MKLLTDLNLSTFYSKIKAIFASKTEMASELAKKSNLDHNHDNRYFTETEVNQKLETKANVSHTHTAESVGARANTWVPTWAEVSSKPGTFTPTLGTTSTTAFRGDHGNTAYTHSQSAHAPSTAQKNSDITKAEIEAKLTGSITTHNHNGQYYTKAEVDSQLSGKAAASHTHSGYVASSSASNINIHADSDANTTTDYALIKAGHNELKVVSSGGGSTVTKGQDKLTFNGNVVYHAGKKPTAAEIGAKPSSYVPAWAEITGKPGTFTPTLGTTSTTAFRGDHGNVAYTHSQSAHAPSTAQKNSDITKAEIEAKLTGSITTHNHNGQYYTKAEVDSQLSGKAAASHTHSGYVTSSSGGTINIHADSDASTTTEYALIKAGHNELKVLSSGGGTTVTKGQDKLTFNGNVVYHAGKKPTAAEVGARPSSWVPAWADVTGKPGTFAPIIGTTSTTAFRGDHGNTAYTHSQQAHAPSNAQKNSDITKAEIEAKLTGTISAHNHNGQYYTKAEINTKLPGTFTIENGDLYVTY